MQEPVQAVAAAEFEKTRVIFNYLEKKQESENAKKAFDEAKSIVQNTFFQSYNKGTNRKAVGSLGHIVLTANFSYKIVGRVDAPIDASGKQISKFQQVLNLAAHVENTMGAAAAGVLRSLFEFEPKLIAKNYTSLNVADPVHKTIKDLVDTILVYEETGKTFKFEPVKGK